MGTTPLDFEATPLLDEAICRELFSAQADPDFAAMQKQIWEGIRADLERDLHGLSRLHGEELKVALHRVRGYCATTSLRRLSHILHAWEMDPEPEARRESFGPEALSTAASSLLAVEQRFPHLVNESVSPPA